MDQSQIHAALDIAVTPSLGTVIPSPPDRSIGLTPQVKLVVRLALDEARGMNHDYIGTEHLLLGLVREGEGVAAGVLAALGATRDRIRAEVWPGQDQPSLDPDVGLTLY